MWNWFKIIIVTIIDVNSPLIRAKNLSPQIKKMQYPKMVALIRLVTRLLDCSWRCRDVTAALVVHCGIIITKLINYADCACVCLRECMLSTLKKSRSKSPVMAMDCPYINFMAFYIISASFLGTNSGRGVTHWKLNEQGNSIVEGNESDRNYVKTDPVFALLIEHYPPKIAPTRRSKTGKNKFSKKSAHGSSLRYVFVTELPVLERRSNTKLG